MGPSLNMNPGDPKGLERASNHLESLAPSLSLWAASGKASDATTEGICKAAQDSFGFFPVPESKTLMKMM